MKKGQTRRKFILSSAKLFATAVGITMLGKTISFSASANAGVNTSRVKRLINSHDQNRILVAYDSYFGSTEEIASHIGKTISTENNLVEVKRINEVESLAMYDKIIIGSAIQYDKWLPEAREFIIKHEQALSSKPTSFFLVCLVLSKNTEAAIQKVNGYADKVENLVPQITVDSFGKFAGVLDYSKMSFGQRILAKSIFAILRIKEGDYRDWTKIEAWALQLRF